MCRDEFGGSFGKVSLTREALIHAAMEVFSERKLSQVTMADIAQRSGMSKANVYNHFRDKDQLFLAAHRRLVMSELGRASEDLLALSDFQTKVARIAQEIQRASAHPLRRLPPELCERALSDPELREDLQHAREEVHEWMRTHLFDPHGALSGHRGVELVGPVFVSFMVMFYPFALMFEPELQQPALLTQFLTHLFESVASASTQT